MLKSKPVVGLLGLLAGFGAALIGWKGWRLLIGRRAGAGSPIEAPAAAGGRTDSPASTAAPTGAPPRGEIAEDEAASAAGPAMAAPESREELADLLPEPDLPATGLTEELVAAMSEPASPSAEAGGSDETQVDAVLEQLAAEADAREPATLQGRFGPGAAPPDEGGVCPPDHPVKGNTNSMIYHLPGQSTYGATQAEVCFADAAAAEAAGFRAPKRKSGATGVTVPNLEA